MRNSDIKLTQVDQTAINYVFEDKNDLNVYYNLLRTKIPMDELEDALINPTIVHFILC